MSVNVSISGPGKSSQASHTDGESHKSAVSARLYQSAGV